MLYPVYGNGDDIILTCAAMLNNNLQNESHPHQAAKPMGKYAPSSIISFPDRRGGYCHPLQFCPRQ